MGSFDLGLISDDLVADMFLQEKFVQHHLDLFLDLLFDHTADMTLVLKCFHLLHILSLTGQCLLC